MKKMLTTLLAAAIVSLAPVVAIQGSAAAVDVFKPCSGGASASSVCSDVKSQESSGTNPIISAIKVVINVLSFIVGIASIIIIVVSGIRLVLSGGDSQAVAGARGAIIYALAGLVVVAVAQGLVAFLLGKL